VDKRRKSAENSPQQTGSPRKGAAELRLNDASFDQNTLAAKFKAGLMQAGPPAQPAERGNTDPERERNTASSGSQDKSHGPSPSFPGGNLPEHHFKKRYFNEEFQRQQQKETERERPAQQEQSSRQTGEQGRPEQRQIVVDQSRGPPAGYDQRRPGMQDIRDQRYDQAMRVQYEQSRGGARSHHQDQSSRPHPDQSRQDPPRHPQEVQRGAQVPEQGRHQDQRMYQDSRRGHYDPRHSVPVDQRHHDPRGQHGDNRPRPQMYPGQGYPDRPPQREYQERSEYPNPRQLHPDQYRHRGPPPAGAGQQGYPGHPYPNPQMMQAMFRHQQMMYGNRPPPPPPNK